MLVLSKRWPNKVVKLIFYGVIFIAFTIPVFWMVLSSFKPTQLIIKPSLVLWFKPTLAHYEYIFKTQNFLRFMVNSLTLKYITVIVAIDNIISCQM